MRRIFIGIQTHSETVLKRQASDVDRFIGQKIREARRSKKMTQSDLAEMMDLTFQQIQKYEKGVNRVSSAMLLDIAQALGKPLVWFYGEHICALPENATTKDILFNECEQLLLQLRGDEFLPIVRDFLSSAVQNKSP